MKFDTFNFDFEKIKKYCDTIQSIKDQTVYLRWVLKEYKNQEAFFNKYKKDDEAIQVGAELRSLTTGRRIILPDQGKYIRARSITEHFPIEKIVNEIEFREELVQSQPEIEDKVKKGSLKKIVWMGTQPDIIALFYLLHRAKLIDQKSFKHFKVLIRDHFTQKGMQPFDNETLGTVEDKNDIKKYAKRIVSAFNDSLKALSEII